MILRYNQLQSRSFNAALSKLINYGGFTDYRELSNLKSLIKQHEKMFDKARTELNEMLKLYCEVNEKGEVAFDKDESDRSVKPRVLKGKEIEFKNAKDAFDKTEVEIKANTIPWESVQNAGLSATDLVMLEGIILPAAGFIEDQHEEKTAASA